MQIIDFYVFLIFPASFEDKRKENFDKGQAELERRRKTLADIQRKEQVCTTHMHTNSKSSKNNLS
jgi:hypothetical protein